MNNEPSKRRTEWSPFNEKRHFEWWASVSISLFAMLTLPLPTRGSRLLLAFGIGDSLGFIIHLPAPTIKFNEPALFLNVLTTKADIKGDHRINHLIMLLDESNHNFDFRASEMK
jgi:hypothetical protein